MPKALRLSRDWHPGLLNSAHDNSNTIATIFFIDICTHTHTHTQTHKHGSVSNIEPNAEKLTSILWLSSVQFSSVTQPCLTLCDPMNRSTPGLPIHHQLLEFTQTHVHRVGDAIQPSHPLSSPSPTAPHPSQHQSLFH